MKTFDFDIEKIIKNKKICKIIGFSLFGLVLVSFVLTTLLQDRNTSLIYFFINVGISVPSCFIGLFLLTVKVRQYSQIIHIVNKNNSSSITSKVKFLRTSEENVVIKFLTFNEIEFIDNKNNIICLYVLADNQINLKKNAYYQVIRTDNVVFEIKETV